MNGSQSQLTSLNAVLAWAAAQLADKHVDYIIEETRYYDPPLIDSDDLLRRMKFALNLGDFPVDIDKEEASQLWTYLAGPWEKRHRRRIEPARRVWLSVGLLRMSIFNEPDTLGHRAMPHLEQLLKLSEVVRNPTINRMLAIAVDDLIAHVVREDIQAALEYKRPCDPNPFMVPELRSARAILDMRSAVITAEDELALEPATHSCDFDHDHRMHEKWRRELRQLLKAVNELGS